MIYSPTKPGISTRIDWSDPLSQGLVGCLTFAEGGGTSTLNLVDGERLILNNLVLTNRGLQKTATGVLGQCSGNKGYPQQGPLTLFMKLKISAVSNGALLWGSPDTSGYYGINIGSTSNTLNFGKDLVTTNLVVSTNASFFALNEVFSFCVSWTGSNMGSGVLFYKNGNPVTVNVSTEGGGANNVSRSLLVGGYYGGANATWTNMGSFLYNRVLSAQEIRQLHELTAGW